MMKKCCGVVVLLLLALSILSACKGGGGESAAYTIGGTVSGLTGTGLVLQNNGADDMNVSANGSFTFAAAVPNETGYQVTVKTQPASQICVVTSGTGTVSGENVTNITVSCSYSIGGTVSGLTGTGLVLQNNGGDDKSISANGSFTFAAGVTSGGSYSVTVKTHPAGQTCGITNASGTVSANVTNISVTCTASFVPPGGVNIGLNIYVSDSGNTRIVNMTDMTGTGWTTLGSAGTGTNQFGSNSPTGIFVHEGQIYAADAGGCRIIRMDGMTGAGWTTLGGGGCGPASNQFDSPYSIYRDTNMATTYIADRNNNRIAMVFNMTDLSWLTLGSFGTGTNEFDHPQSVAVDNLGRIYIADQGNSRIVRINDMFGNGWTALGSFGTGTNQFDSPNAVALDSTERIYVLDGANNRIVRIDDMTGTGWTTFGSTGTGTNQFGGITGISFDYANRIYVVDGSNNRIVRFNDMAGTGWTALGSFGTGTNQFNMPFGIFVR